MQNRRQTKELYCALDLQGSMLVYGFLCGRAVIALKTAVDSQVSAYKSRDYYVVYILVDYESAISAAIPSINEMGIVINQTARMNTYQRLKGPDGLSRSACEIRFPTS